MSNPPIRFKRLYAVLGAVMLCASVCGSARADERIKGDIQVTTDGGYARLIFRFKQEDPATIRVNFPIVILTFKKPVDVAVDRLNISAPGYISAARIDPDGSAIRIALAQPLKVHSIPAAEQLFVDLLPQSWSGVLPGLPQEVIESLARRAQEAERLLRRQQIAAKQLTPQSIRVRVATQPTFSRYVFDLPEGANVVPDQRDHELVLNFDQKIKWDLADALATMPSSLKSIAANVDEDSTRVIFVLNGDPKLRTFREGNGIAVDVGIDGAAPRQEGVIVPGITPPQTVPPDGAKPATQGASVPPAALPKIAGNAPPAAAAPAAAKLSPAEAAPKPMQENAAAPKPRAPMADLKPAGQNAAVAQGSAAKPAEPKPAQPSPAPTIAAAMPAGQKPAPREAMATKPAQAKPIEAAAPQAMTAAPQAPAPTAPKVEPAQPAAAAKPEPARPPPAAVPKIPVPPMPPPKAAANPSEPAPDPKGTVAAELHHVGNDLRIEFPFVLPTPAAIFGRADTVWLVFDSLAKVDLAALHAGPDQDIRSAVFERSKDGAAIVRLRLARPHLVSAIDDGPSWIVNIGDSVTSPSQPLVIARSALGKNRASIAIPFDHARKIHDISDPSAGDRLLVVTALAPIRGFLKSQEFVELRALPSAQGVVLEPLADDITAAIAPDKITVTRPHGLTLSATAIGQQQLASAFRAVTFDTQIWGFDRQAEFYPRQSELIYNAAMAPPGQRRHARLNLARFYIAQNMLTEAKGVLDFALSQEHGADDVTGTVLKAVTNVMLDRPHAALKDLANPQVGNQLDAPIWRAMAYAREGQWTEAHSRFKQVSAELAALPIELQRLALRSALRAAIEVRDFGDAGRVLNELQTMGVPPDLAPSIGVLVGQLDEGLGRNEDALTNYRAAAASRDRPVATQAHLREIALRYALGDMPRKDVVSDLETLTTVWRGDETETEGLKLLAHLYTEEGHYREAFHVMRTALLAHPNSDLTRKIEDEAAATFDSLFLGDKANALSPIEALGLFYDYRELTPIGRRGDEMIRKLADRLVSVDLLDQAAQLLQHQVDQRLQGAARAQVATRLAVIYLMDRKPDRALAALRSTRTGGLSNELRDQRLLLEARALSDIGRRDLALEMIENIPGHEAIRLRADILWAAKRWRQAAEQIELLYGDRWRQFEPLNEGERVDILRAAIGYALANESIGLQRFRDKYMAKMSDSPDAHAFEVVTAPTGTGGAEFKDVAQAVAGVDTLDAFLSDMRKRYPDSNAVSPEASAQQPAPAPAPAPSKPAAAAPQAGKAAPEQAAAITKPGSGAQPPASKPPAGAPPKPDRSPTGSIRRLP